MTARSRRPSLLSLLLLGSVLCSMIAWPPPEAAAQIINNSASPMSSAVDCIRSPSEFGEASDARPRFAITCFSSAWDKTRYEDNGDPFIGNAPGNTQAVIEFGDGQPNNGSEPGHTLRASLGTGGSAGGGVGVGAVFGLAFSSGTNPAAVAAPNPAARASRLFTSAFTKRITRYGSGGPGAIYVLNRNTNNEQLFAQVPNVVPGPPGGLGSDGSRTNWPNQIGTFPAHTPEMGGIHGYEHDNEAKPWVGRTSLGDMELEPSERYLAVVNLYQRNIYYFDTWATNPAANRFDIPLDLAGCPGGWGNFRPFGLAYQAVAGKPTAGYVGYVCSAETTGQRADLRAGVLRFEGLGNWSRVLDFPLAAFDSQRSEQGGIYNYPWQPWSNNFMQKQPLLSGIEIAENGDMILGLRDRSADVGGNEAAGEFSAGNGDMLVAKWNGTGWNAPGTARPEHFYDKGYNDDYWESLWGSAAYVPGNRNGTYGGEVAATHGYIYRGESGNAAWFDISTGTRTATEQIYPTDAVSENYFMMKSSGLGDIELLCSWRAIGNRVWRDTNGNGLQEAGEPSINGVRLQLFTAAGADTGIRVTTGSLTSTDDNFRFYVPPYLDYQVRIDPAMFNAGQPLFGMAPTAANVGANDEVDSDTATTGILTVAAGPRSELDYRWDMGFASGGNVRIVKSAPISSGINQTIAYTLSWWNDGPGMAQNVVVQDTLPTGVVYSYASSPPSVSGQTLTWNLGNLPAASSGTITIVSTLTGVGPTVQNCARISTTSTGDNLADNNSCANTTVLLPNLTMVKTGAATVIATNTIAYTLTYRNTGQGTALNATVQDVLPAGLTYLSASPTPSWTLGQTVVWNLGNIAPGTVATITVNARVTVNAATSISNCATISTPTQETTTADNSSCRTSTVQKSNVTVAKTGPLTAVANQVFAYTLTYRNTGNLAAAGVRVTDTLPAGVTFVNANPAQSSVSGQTVTWNVGNLPAGAVRTITVNVRAATTFTPSTAVSMLATNNVCITTTSLSDDPLGPKCGSATSTLQRPEIEVVKTGPPSALVGDVFNYTLTYRNVGTSAAAPVTISDTLPAGLALNGAAPTGCTYNATTRLVSCTIASLAAGASGTITLPVRASITAAASVNNTGTINTTTPGDTPSGNTSTTTTAILFPNPGVTISISPSPFPVGTSGNVTVNFANTGTGTARTTTLIVDLTSTPSTVIYNAGAMPAGCSYASSNTPARRRFTCNLGDLAPGATGSRVLPISLPANFPLNAFTATATISTITPERTADLPNNTATTSVNVVRPDVWVTATGPSNLVSVAQGSHFFYNLNYGNGYAGSPVLPTAAANVVLVVQLPPDVDYVATVSGPSPSSVSGQTLTWNLGTLAAGATGSIRLHVVTRVPAGVTLVMNASISTTTPGDVNRITPSDPDGDNFARVTTDVVQPPVTLNPVASDIRLAIRSELDPNSADSDPTNGVYISDGAQITWPAGEVLDFTPRLTSFDIDESNAPFPYEYRARIVGWSITGFEVNGVAKNPQGADSRGVSGCRAGASPNVAPQQLTGCPYGYVGGGGSGVTPDNLLPTAPLREDQMLDQGHVYWTPPPALSMRNDVYLYTVDPLVPVKLSVAVEVEVWLVNAYPGASLEPPDMTYAPVEITNPGRRRQVIAQTFDVTLLVPRSIVGPGNP